MVPHSWITEGLETIGVVTNVRMLFAVSMKKWGSKLMVNNAELAGADLGGGSRGCAPPTPEMTCGSLTQLVFCENKKRHQSAKPFLSNILDPP